jgi:putative glycosyltransferase (TIGR04372 family)
VTSVTTVQVMKDTPQTSRAMQSRKTGLMASISRKKRAIRAALPSYKIFVILSIFGGIVYFFFRMAGAFSNSQNLRSFRWRLFQYLRHEEAVAGSEIEAALQGVWYWENTLSPQAATKLINDKIVALRDDPRVSELYFLLAAAYYLSGDYPNYERATIQGLEKLKASRSSVHKGLNTKFLFTADWGWVIGHTSHLDQLVRLRELGLLSPERRVLVLSPEDGANKHYLNYWRRHLEFMLVSKHEADVLRSVMQPLAEKLTGFELKTGFATLYEAWNIAGDLWAKERRPPLLDLDPNDAERGAQVLKKWGMSDGAWFVALHVREYDAHAPNHNRLRAAPNADIGTYMPAIRAIIARGGWVIRMGDPSMSALSPMPGLVDYANSADKSEWMDVFLWAACKFFIGTSSGPLTVPASFGVPVLYTNCCGMGHSPALGRSLVLPKLFYSKSEQRLLTVDEILAGPFGWTVRVPGEDIQLRDNSPEEIQAGVEEMFLLLEGGSDAFDTLTELQLEFSRRRERYGRNASTPISHSFIATHRDLLEPLRPA